MSQVLSSLPMHRSIEPAPTPQRGLLRVPCRLTLLVSAALISGAASSGCHGAEAGLLSDLEYQQRRSLRAVAEADVKAGEAQVQAQADLLRYYRIAAPSDGTLGDVPVKIGDYVTPQTRLTSVDQDNLVEAYVY